MQTHFRAVCFDTHLYRGNIITFKIEVGVCWWNVFGKCLLINFFFLMQAEEIPLISKSSLRSRQAKVCVIPKSK